ncbi:MAG: hypothetical protein COB59_01625 [Rhodospirillaceae bacterium]|nr:MAG: hypothetical protein COB59_01625 [Rhodospirillaceae bacterium]
MKTLYKLTAVAFALSVSGCGSIAKGITEAFLDRPAAEDRRLCEIRGAAFPGLRADLDKQTNTSGGNDRTLKVLMVHGIGEHIPGYSARLSEKLAHQLNLTVISEGYKEINLKAPPSVMQTDGENDLGQLRIQRFTNKQRDRELLFYELTWSDILAPEKELLAFDDSGTQTSKRATVNRMIKEFFNSHVPDPMIYLGKSKEKILQAVGQSICWMVSKDWQGYDDTSNAVCRSLNPVNAEKDDYALITHSLGSRVVIDSLQRIAALTQKGMDKLSGADQAQFSKTFQALQNKRFPIYMLANQLPLLQLGREAPTVSNQIDQYCRADGPNYKNRMFKELNVVAFSDPNDILSYSLPPGFSDKYIDSRLCPRVVNVAINIAPVVDLLGLGEFANPATAHNDYEADDRVISIIADGIGMDTSSTLIAERCQWLETIRD